MRLLFSIIIPVYNADKYIDRCLESLLNQNYQELEIVLIDDGSTDQSPQICDAYALRDCRVRVIHQENQGVAVARNAGLDIATGDYIGFVDPDDWVENKIFDVLNGELENGSIDVLRYNAFRQGEILNALPFQGKYTEDRLENEFVLPLIGAEKFGGMFILGVLWLHVFRRDLIQKYKIRFSPNLRRCEDRLFTLTCVLHAHNVKFIDAVLYNYAINDDSLSNKYDAGRWAQELLYLDKIQKEYTSCRSVDFISNADSRLKSEYLLRAIMSINNEFFSNNTNSLSKRYSHTKKILRNTQVKNAVKTTPMETLELKGKITISFIRMNLPLMLTLFNTIILLKNKLRPHG